MSEKINISIIDDNIDICNILTDYFEKISDMHICSVTHNGEDGLDNIIKHQPDILLLDLIIPQLDGFGILNHLRNLNLKTKVIMLTAINCDSIAQEAFSLGSCYYMLKPFKLSVLEERIRSIYNFHQSKDFIHTSSAESNESLIIKKLIQVGIPTNVLGYQYIIDAISMLIDINTPILIKDIYEKIAKKNITTTACVESAMRNAILQAMNHNSDKFSKLFSDNNKRPTNSQFITKIRQSIKVGL